MSGETHFNHLTPAQAERLACLAEELGEAVQVIGKILRHGFDSSDPTWTDEETRAPTNRELLERELGDVAFWMVKLQEERDVSATEISIRTVEKRAKVRPFLHHQVRP